MNSDNNFNLNNLFIPNPILDRLFNGELPLPNSEELYIQREQEKKLNRETPSKSTRPKLGEFRRVPSYKRGTADCKFYLKGTCKYGNDCSFKHPYLDKNYQPIVCKYFAAGYCQYRDSCPYSHPIDVLETDLLCGKCYEIIDGS